MLTLLAVLTLSLPAQDALPPLDCKNPRNTLEINECAAAEVAAEEARMQTYLTRAMEAVRESADSPELGEDAAAQMAQAQAAWEAYAEAECSAVYKQYEGGSIRGLMRLSCTRDLTLERTHHVWETYLTFLDSSEPLLPEPLPLGED